MDINNSDTVTDYYVVFPHTATIDKIHTVISGAIAAADKVLTASIGGVAVTNGVVTIANAASAAGDIDTATPTANKSISAGAALKLAATGASTGAARIQVTILYTRTA